MSCVLDLRPCKTSFRMTFMREGDDVHMDVWQIDNHHEEVQIVGWIYPIEYLNQAITDTFSGTDWREVLQDVLAMRTSDDDPNQEMPREDNT